MSLHERRFELPRRKMAMVTLLGLLIALPPTLWAVTTSGRFHPEVLDALERRDQLEDTVARHQDRLAAAEASQPPPQTLERWGPLPYRPELVHLATYCRNPDRAEETCSEGVDDTPMTHEDAQFIVASTALVAQARKSLAAAERREARAGTALPAGPSRSRGLLARLAAVAGSLLVALGVWFRPRRSLEVVVTPHVVRVGRREISTDDLVGCDVVGDRLELKLTQRRRHRTPPLDLSADELEAIAARIREAAPTREQRKEAARARLESAALLAPLRNKKTA